MNQAAVAPSQQLRVILTSNGLEEERAVLIAEKFNDFFLQGNEWAEKAKSLSVTSSEQVLEMKQAREGRLFLKQRRVGIENLRKDLKERSLKEGRAIDMIAKHLTSLIEPTERYLEEQERFPIREMARLRREMLNSRYERLGLYEAGNNMTESSLALMAAPEFEEYMDMCRQAYENKQEREKEQSEKLRRETQEKECLRLENLRLHAELQQQQLVFKETQSAHKTEQKERIRLQDEARSEHDRQLRQQREEAEQARQASLATDREKALKFATTIAKLHIPEVENDDAQAMIAHAHSLLMQAQTYLERHANRL